MSINYYARPRVGIRKIKQLEKILTDNGYSKDIAKSALHHSVVHLGKYAFGWQFCFNHNNWKHFKNNRKSVEEFTKRYIIQDQYGNKVTYLRFWKMVDFANKGMVTDRCIYNGLWFDTDFS